MTVFFWALAIGMIVPATGAIRLMVVPTPRAQPYGMVVDSKGMVFFVEFGSNKIGSIDPDTLAIREYVLPHTDSRPRRIAVTGDDVLFLSETGATRTATNGDSELGLPLGNTPLRLSAASPS